MSTQETEFKERRLQNDTLVYTTTTIVRSKTQVKSVSDDSTKRSDQNTLIIVILLVVTNIINYMDRLTLAGKFTILKHF